MPVLFKNRHLLGDKGDGSFGFGRLVVVVGERACGWESDYRWLFYHFRRLWCRLILAFLW
jgi:hypothetical protein